MYHFLSSLDSFVWGPPLLVFLVGTGFYLSVRLRLLQVFRLPKAIKLIFASDSDGYLKLCGLGNGTGGDCRNRKCGWRCNCYKTWRTWSPLLDVDGCLLWYGNQVC